jgi:hypothetical protein
VQKDLLDALQKLEQMTAEKKRLLEENDALKGKVHLLQFKVSARSASRAHAATSLHASPPLQRPCLTDLSARATQVELLVDMVTLANLDCDKLEDELEAVTNG